MKTQIFTWKKVLLIVLATVFGWTSSMAQNAKFEMVTGYGSSGADEPRYAVTDAEGNYYAVGFGAGNIQFNDNLLLTGRGGNDALLVKYDNDMNLAWARYVGGAASEAFEGVAVNSLGDVYAVGQIGSASTIDDASAIITPSAAQEGMVVIFDKNGNYKTHRLISGTSATVCYSISIDKNDNVYIGGAGVGPIDFGNGKTVTPANGTKMSLFLAKYDKNLNCQWAVSGNCDELADAAIWTSNVDKDGNILFAGRFGKTINIIGTDQATVTNTPSISTGTQEGFLAKVSSDGVCRWIRTVVANNRVDMKGIDSDSQGNVVVMGFSQAAVTIEGNSAAYGFAGNMDNFVAKFSATGDYANGFSLGGPGRDEGKSVFVDNNDDIYIAGNMNGVAAGSTIDFNPKGSSPVNRTCYGHDGYYAKYKGSTLELIQVEKTTSPANSTPHEVAFNVTMSKDFCRIYVLGYFNNANTVFDGETGSAKLANKGGYDIYLTTYATCLMIKTRTLPEGTKGAMYYASIEADNITGTVSYAVTAGSLPSGVDLSASGGLSGVPAEAGSFKFTVTATDASSSKSREYTLVIASGSDCDVFITTYSCPNAKTNNSYSFQFEADGEGTITWSKVSGTIPDGLTLSTSGLLSGTPGGSNALGLYKFTVKASKDVSCFDEIEVSLILEEGDGVGIDQMKLLESYQLYPVPADTELFLRMVFSEVVNARLQVITPTGINVWEKQYNQVASIDESIPVTNLSAGVYYVLLTTDDGRITKPVIIK